MTQIISPCEFDQNRKNEIERQVKSLKKMIHEAMSSGNEKIVLKRNYCKESINEVVKELTQEGFVAVKYTDYFYMEIKWDTPKYIRYHKPKKIMKLFHKESFFKKIMRKKDDLKFLATVEVLRILSNGFRGKINFDGKERIFNFKTKLDVVKGEKIDYEIARINKRSPLQNYKGGDITTEKRGKFRWIQCFSKES